MIEAERFALGSRGLPLGASRGGYSGPGRVLGLFVSQPRTVRAEGRLAPPFGPLDDFPFEEPVSFDAETVRRRPGTGPAWRLPAPEEEAPPTLGAHRHTEVAPPVHERVESQMWRRTETPASPIVTPVRPPEPASAPASAPAPESRAAQQARPPRESKPVTSVPLPAVNIFHESSAAEPVAPLAGYVPDTPPTRELLRASEPAEPHAPAPAVYVRARHEIPVARARILREPAIAQRVHTETVAFQAPERPRIEVTTPPHARFDEMPLDSLPPRRSGQARGKRVYIENLQVTLERPASAAPQNAAGKPQSQRTESPSRPEPTFDYVNPWLRSAGFLD